MSVQVSYPGVYIDEFTPAAPIQGVATSTAAFIGLNAFGPPNRPTLITSWDGYVRNFMPPGDPAKNSPEDDDYLWYAVRGFFQNGGKICFVTAVSNASPDSAMLPDSGSTPDNTILLVARQAGQLSPAISATASPTATVATARLFEPTATISSTAGDKLSVTLSSATDAAQFLAGDRVQLDTLAAGEPAVVSRISGKVVFFASPLSKAYSSKGLRLADLPSFADSFRVTNADTLVAGAIVTLAQNGASSVTRIVKRVSAERISTALTTFRVTLTEGINGFVLYKTGNNPITLKAEEFDLDVDGHVYASLSMNPGHPRYFVEVINGDPAGKVMATPIAANRTALPDNRPNGTVQLTGGSNYDPALIKSRSSDYEAALKRLEGISDINLVAVPDRTDQAVQVAVRDHCLNMLDRFAILDSARGTALAAIDTQRNWLENDKGYAALYYPWIEVASQRTGKRITIPPCGHISGIYARTDNTRGVHKAPAGTECTINGALGVDQVFSDSEQGLINMKGINVIRVFRHGGAPVVWGARTTSANTNWQYVNIRRLFIFLEQSIQRGIRGAVFEPNNIALWQKLKRTINAFLTQQWRDGALFGAKAEEAFYVRIDEALNPDNERALGRLYIEIGVRPSYPAEFIIVRIGIWQGGSEVSEA